MIKSVHNLINYSSLLALKLPVGGAIQLVNINALIIPNVMGREVAFLELVINTRLSL